MQAQEDSADAESHGFENFCRVLFNVSESWNFNLR